MEGTYDKPYVNDLEGVTLPPCITYLRHKIQPPPHHYHNLCSFSVTCTPPPPHLGKKEEDIAYPLSRVLVTIGNYNNKKAKKKILSLAFSGNLPETIRPKNNTTSCPEKMGTRTCMWPPYAFEWRGRGAGFSYQPLTLRWLFSSRIIQLVSAPQEIRVSSDIDIPYVRSIQNLGHVWPRLTYTLLPKPGPDCIFIQDWTTLGHKMQEGRNSTSVARGWKFVGTGNRPPFHRTETLERPLKDRKLARSFSSLQDQWNLLSLWNGSENPWKTIERPKTTFPARSP